VQSACAIIARPDEHITALTAEITRLCAEAASPLLPGPIRQRLDGRAAALEKIAERHARTRITPGRRRCPSMSAARLRSPWAGS
jgi:hypothetical protein